MERDLYSELADHWGVTRQEAKLHALRLMYSAPPPRAEGGADPAPRPEDIFGRAVSIIFAGVVLVLCLRWLVEWILGDFHFLP